MTVSERSSGERSDPGVFRSLIEGSRMSRSLSSGAHSRDPLAHPGYALRCVRGAALYLSAPWRQHRIF